MRSYQFPWSRLIVRYPDGVAMYAVYSPDNDGVTYSWKAKASFLDTEVSPDLAQDYIDNLPQQVVNQISTLNTQQQADIGTTKQDYYKSNPRLNKSLDDIDRDGVVRNILPL